MRGSWNPLRWMGRTPPPPRPERERLARVSPPRTPRGEDARPPAVARVEAALFEADRPLSAARLAKVAHLADARAARVAADDLARRLDQDDSPVRLEQLASGYRLMTRPRYAAWLARLFPRRATLGLSPTAMETLTIIAYRQPLTRADAEAIRGAQSLEIIKQLADRGLVKIVGEDDSLGRPFLYGTTPKFLEQFALSKIEDLPDYASLNSEEL